MIGKCRAVTDGETLTPQVLLAQFSLYVHKGGLEPDSFHFILIIIQKVLFYNKQTQTFKKLSRGLWVEGGEWVEGVFEIPQF